MASHVLLGIFDEPIQQYEVNLFTSKIGGSPDWVTPIEKPNCTECKESMMLVVQLYCPLGGSLYHRTLYLFTCIKCKGKRWTLIRQQKKDENSKAVKKQEASPVSKSGDWGMDADDWGTDANDWGNNQDGLNNKADDWDCANKDMGLQTHGDKNCSTKIENTMGNVHKREEIDLNSYESVVKSVVDEINGTQLLDKVLPQNLNECGHEDSENALSSDLSNMEIENVNSETNPNVLVEENFVDRDRAENLMKVLNSDNSHVTEVSSGNCLMSYYISVIEEPENDIDSGEKEHIKKLLKNYEREQGAINEDLSKGGDGAGSTGEKYEKSSFGDKYFHKFSKRISRCPGQIIRYEWNGSPLHISRSGEEQLKSTQQSCTNCGGAVVFEFQLMPSLINCLRFEDIKDSGIEYGTVLMFTCKASCWTDNMTHCNEHVLVQADPDQHLFQQKFNK